MIRSDADWIIEISNCLAMDRMRLVRQRARVMPVGPTLPNTPLAISSLSSTTVVVTLECAAPGPEAGLEREVTRRAGSLD